MKTIEIVKSENFTLFAIEDRAKTTFKAVLMDGFTITTGKLKTMLAALDKQAREQRDAGLLMRAEYLDEGRAVLRHLLASMGKKS